MSEPEKSKISCKQPGKVAPKIDMNRCEAQADCVRVCPCDVFEIKSITVEDKSALSIRGRLKTWVHGGDKAYATNAQNCHACGLCVRACPEDAIELVQISPS